jgi:hypothetical protein
LPLDGEEKLRGALDAPPLPLLLLPPRAQGGRSLEFMRAVCGVAGRLELPKPCGARPASVALPWAFQLRPEAGWREGLLFNELVGREPLVLLKEPFGRALLLLNEPLGRVLCGCDAVGGRLDDGCDGRPLLKLCGLFPPRLKLPAGLLLPA